jgi:hypothetical protein
MARTRPSFSADAIGFFLQLNDELTPALGKAASNYRKFIAQLSSLNKRGYATLGKGMDAMASLVDSFAEMPKEAVRAYDAARKALARRVKPLTQVIKLEFTPRSSRELGAAVSRAVAKAMVRVKFRLSPAMPTKRVAMFERGSLRREYRNMPQPPDFMGQFRVPRFARGGIVNGPPGTDKVLAALTTGELVVPAEATKDLLAQVGKLQGQGGGFVSAGPMGEQYSLMQSMLKALPKLQENIGNALDPTAGEDFARGLSIAEETLNAMIKSADGLHADTKRRLIPVFAQMRTRIEGLKAPTVEATSLLEQLFARVLSPVRFLAVQQALKSMGASWQNIKAEVGGFAAETASKVGSFNEGMYEANRLLGLSRSDVRAFGKDYLAAADKLGMAVIGPEKLASTMAALVNAGYRGDIDKGFAATIGGLSKWQGMSEDALAQMSFSLEKFVGDSQSATEIMVSAVKMAQQSFIKPAELMDQYSRIQKSPFMARVMKDVSDPAQRKGVIKGVLALTASLDSVWAGTADDFMNTLGTALTDPSSDAYSAIQRAFGDPEELLQQMIANPEQVLQRIGQMAQQVGSDPKLMGYMQTIFGANMDLSNLVALEERFKEVIPKFKQLSQIKVNDPSAVVREGLHQTESAFSSFIGYLQSKFVGLVPASVLDFFDNLSVSAMHSTVYLLKELKVFKLLGKITGIGGGGQTPTPILTPKPTPLPAPTPTVPGGIQQIGTWGQSLASLGKGAGTAIKDVMVGLAQGFAAFANLKTIGGLAVAGGALLLFMWGLSLVPTETLWAAIPFLLALGPAMWLAAAGIAALTSVLPAFAAALASAAVELVNPLTLIGLAALTIALIGIGFAVKLALTPLAEIVKSLATFSVGQLLALGPALLMLGPGLTVMGTGILALSACLLLSVPGLAAFAGLSKLFGWDGGKSGGLLATAINGIAGAFKVDEAAVSAALRGVEMSVQFMSGFLKLAAMATAAGVLAGALGGGGIVGKVLYAITWFFVGDPLENLKSLAGRIGTMVNDLAVSLGPTKLNQAVIKSAIDGVTIAAQFMVGFGKIVKTVQETAPIGGVFGAISVFLRGDPVEEMKKVAPRMVELVQGLAQTIGAESFRSVTDDAVKGVEAAGKFMDGIGKIAEGVKKVAALSPGGLFGKMAKFFYGDEFENFQKSIPAIRTGVELAVKEFEPMVQNGMVDKAKATAEVLEASAPVFTSMGTIAEAVEKSRKALSGNLFQTLGGAEERIKKIAKAMGGGMKPLVENLAALVPSMQKLGEPAQVSTMFTSVTTSLDQSVPILGKGKNLIAATKGWDVAAWQGTTFTLMQIVNDLARVQDSIAALISRKPEVLTPLAINAMSQLGQLVDAANKLAVVARTFDVPGWQASVATLSAIPQGLTPIYDALASLFSTRLEKGAAMMRGTQDFIVQLYSLVASTADLGRLLTDSTADTSNVEKNLKPLMATLRAVTQQVTDLQRVFPVVPVTKAEIAQVTQVHVDGTVTADDTGTHERLDRLIQLMASMVPQSANQPRRPVVPSEISEVTENLAGGVS